MTTSGNVTVREAVASRPSLGYIPGLDGIRALAVLAVMLFHFGLGWIPGGYIGVDVFFVLSGFLITTLLVQRLPEPFNARRFWERRARRLFPALAVMLVAVFLYALTQPALEQAAIRGQGIATVFYVNNWWLLFSGQQYFDAYQQPSPLIHTWTLSVEEQWYIVLPLLLLLLVAVRRFSWRWVVVLLAGLAGLSTAWTVLLEMRGASIDRMYLSTDTRAQQLLLGGLLAVLGARAVEGNRSRLGFLPAPGVLGLMGLLGLVGMFLVWPEGNWVAAQLTLAAVMSAMLIAGVVAGSTRVSRWLSWEPLRRIGIISYGLYLWHWPITVMVGSEQTNAPTPLRLVLTFAAAGASYVLIERPIRAGRIKIAWFLMLPVVLVVMAVLCTPKAGQSQFARALPDHEAPPFSGQGTTVFFVGDSVSGSLWLPRAGSPTDEVAVTGSFLLGCPLFELEFVADGSVVAAPEGLDCPAWEQQWRADMQQMSPEVGVFVGTSSFQFDVLDEAGNVQPFGSNGYRLRIEQALDGALRDFTADRIAITSVPCTTLPSNPINDLKNDRARTATLNDVLRQFSAQRGYDFVDIGDTTCAADNEQLYIDGLHLSPAGALRVWEGLTQDLRGSAR